MELNTQSQPSNNKDIARSFKIATKPEFMRKYAPDREWLKKL